MTLRTMILSATLCASAPALLLAQPPAGAPPPGGGRPAFQAKNLKVLPPDTNIIATMRGFEQALGVECQFCHAADPTTHRTDFASDANPRKDTARAMIRMTQDLNTKYLAQLPNRAADDNTMIACGTCHRGQSVPPAFTPAPRQGPGGPGGMAPGGAPAPAPGPGL